MSHQAKGYRVRTSHKKEKRKKNTQVILSLTQIMKLIQEKNIKYVQSVPEECIDLQVEQILGTIIKSLCIHKHTYTLCLAHVYGSLKH